MLKVLDNELKDKKFFVGDKFGFADIVANMVALQVGVYEEASGVVLVTSQNFFLKFVLGEMNILIVAQSKYLPPRRDELLLFSNPVLVLKLQLLLLLQNELFRFNYTLRYMFVSHLLSSLRINAFRIRILCLMKLL